MEVRTKIPVMLAICFIAVPQSYSQVAKGYAVAADSQAATCNQSGSTLTRAECDNLALEFSKDRTALTARGLKDSLRDPFADLTPFIVGIRQRAFEHIANQALNTGLSAMAQSALNDTAQLLSTKAAVNQTGAQSSASGSTNLATKPTTTDLISLAAESGAFTDTVNGNSLTAQANADGVRRYLSGKPFADLSPSTLDVLDHLTFAATFTIAQNGSTAVPTSGSALPSTPSISSVLLPSNNVSFNALSANYELYRPYNPHSTAFLTAWQKAIKENAPALASAITAVEIQVLKASPARVATENDPAFIQAQSTWISDAKSDEENNNFSKFVSDYTTFTESFETALEKADPNNFYSDVLSINSALQALRAVNNDVLNAARGTPLLTVSYSYSAPEYKEATHTATLVAAYIFRQWNGAQLTGNFGGSWFAHVPQGAVYGRVQSYQFSAEYDQPIGSATAPRAVLSLAGYGQYQYSPTVLTITTANLAPGTNIALPGNAQVLLGTAGWLGVAQAKLAFNVGKGLTIPVAFKWSNKTDLLPESDWKGQFGVTYDLSALSAMLSGNK